MGRQHVAASGMTRDALVVLGGLVREARHGRGWTQADLAARALVSVRTVAAIEAGDPTVAVGRVLDAALLVGLPVFSTTDPDELARMRHAGKERLGLLPARVGRKDDDVDLDF